MKNILLIFLLANILYFVWGLFAPGKIEPGVEVVDESKLGPPLSVAQTPRAEVLESVGAVLGSGEPSDLNAVVGQSCVTVGPFESGDDADRAQTRYVAEGMRVSQRTATGQKFTGQYWVQVRTVTDRAESNRMLDVLKSGGLPDAYPIDTDDEGRKIMLGLFGALEGAEKVELQAASLGIDADITPRTSDAVVVFVDIALPPGKGASEIVELHGEDKVLLRDAATCPLSQ
jgi:hypothetical protein